MPLRLRVEWVLRFVRIERVKKNIPLPSLRGAVATRQSADIVIGEYPKGARQSADFVIASEAKQSHVVDTIDMERQYYIYIMTNKM